MKRGTKKFNWQDAAFIIFWLALALLALSLLGCKTYHSPSGKAFPRSWGKPPEIQTKDYRPLPYNYGYGSSTLYHWIMENKGNEIQHELNDLPDSILLNGPDR